MKVPAFLLRRLYVPGSLRNTDGGWQFTIRNSIAPGETVGLSPLVVDGQEVPPHRCFFHVRGEPVPFSAVDAANPAAMQSGTDIVVSAQSEPLPPGRHTVAMGFEVPVVGHLSFDFTDEIG